MVWTVSAICLMGEIVPRMLEVWVQVTSFVFGDKRPLRTDGESWGLILDSAPHQMSLQFLSLAS